MTFAALPVGLDAVATGRSSPPSPRAAQGADRHPNFHLYPYRGHAVNFADFDRNGTVEIAQINGGPAQMPDIVREPNRLYSVSLPEVVHKLGAGSLTAAVAFGEADAERSTRTTRTAPTALLDIVA